MADQNVYFSPSLLSLQQQENKDTYYIPKLQQTVEAGEYASERDIEISALKKMAGKNNNAFLMGMRNLDEPIDLNLFDGYVERKAEQMGMKMRSPAWEATKGAIQGIATSPLKFAGYAATNSLPLIAKTATSLYALSGAAGDTESADKWVREANKGIEAWSREVQRLTGIDESSMAENIVGNAIASAWGSVAIGGLFGGASVAPMFGVSAAQDTYVRQREAGTGIGESAARGAWHGAGEYYFEKLQFNRIFGALSKKSKPIAIIKDLLENAVQEGLQQANEQSANWNIDNRSLIEKLQEIGVSMVGGAVASLAGSVGGNILNRKTINEVGDLMKRTGHTDEEIKAVKDNLNKIVDSDELEQAANMVANDELTTVALTYKEQAQAVSEELVGQLNNTITRNELVDIPGEIQGKPADMPPLYQLGDLKVDTQKNPGLAMVLYQADKEGKPFETLGQVLEWTQGKLDVARAKELSTGVSSVYAQTYEQLKSMGQDDVLADRNARMRSAAAFSLAKVMNSSVEEADKALGGITSMKVGEFIGKQRIINEENIHYQIAGEKSKTALLNNLQKAKEMEENHYSRDDIYDATGWWKAKDGKWRYEISDKDAHIIRDSLAALFDKKTAKDLLKENMERKNNLLEQYRSMPESERNKLLPQLAEVDKEYNDIINKPLKEFSGTLLKDVFSFDEIYKAYPFLNGTKVVVEDKSKKGYVAAYVEGKNEIILYRDAFDELLDKEKKGVFVHEIQHAIQEVEDFARGGDAADALDLLERTLSRVENSRAMRDYEDALEKVDFYSDVANIIQVSQNPNTLTKKGWWQQNVFSTPKKNGKYWKTFVDEKAQEYIDEIRNKYKGWGALEYEFNEELMSGKSYDDIMKERKSWIDKCKRAYNKIDFKSKYFAKAILDAYEKGDVTENDIYYMIFGEMEAYNVEKRSGFSEEERKEKRPYETQLYPDEKLSIVMLNGKLVPMSTRNVGLQEMRQGKDFYATHNVDRGGLRDALKLGGFAMPSFAVKTIGGEANMQFGEITLVGNKNLAAPSRSVEVYDRDAWSPSIAQALRYDLSPKANTFVKNVLSRYGRERELSTFVYNITDELKNPLGNTMAIRLYRLDKGLSEDDYIIENQSDYLDWYDKNIFENAEPYLWTENDANTDMIRRKFTLQNMMKYLRKQERSGGGFLGDYPDANRLLQYFSYKFPSLKEMKARKGNITTREEQYQGIKKLDEQFFELAQEIKKDGQEYDFYDGERALAYALVTDQGAKEMLEREKMKSDDETIKKIEAFKEKLKTVATDYFESKPRRIVGIEEFSGAILPNTKEYDDIANQLEQRGLSVKRIEKGNGEQQKQALEEIAKEKPDVLFQKEDTTARGAYYNNTIYLFENANESTFVHEMSHAYMDALQRLADNGNQQAQRDLNVIRQWLGKKKGQEFTQADWERFARGFEMYLREGKAPNEYLGGVGGVFDNFKNWLLNIYSGVKSLFVTNEQGQQEPVKINKQIKDFYDEMLGGEDIDKVLDTAQKNQQAMTTIQNKLQELSDIKQVMAEEKAKLVREMANRVKPESTWVNVKDWGNNLIESAKELPTNVLQSSYARLAKIDPKLGLLVQRAEQSQGLRIKRWTDEIRPFYEAFNKLSASDKAKVQFYLLNQQWGEVEDLLGQENTDAVRDMLKEIYDELIASGVEVGYRDNYFPRSVIDYDGLLQEMGLTYPQLRKEMEEAIGKDATPEQQAEWLDKHIMGFKGNVSTKGNKYTKERKLELITDAMAKYYKPSMESLVDYVEGMAKLLSMREVFGKDIDPKDSVGKNIERMFNQEKLSKKEIDEIKQVLSALYMPNGVGNKFIQAMRQYGYATKLSYSTTIRQFADIGMMMKVNGVLNTLEALFHPDKRITLENLGIDPLGEEFKTSKKDVGGKIANFTTKWRGINWADAVMKNAFMRGSYKDLQNLAKTPDKFHEKYDSLFGDETYTLIKDLNNDKLSEPVKALLFHEISKIQPISRSAMPTAYLSNPNGRVFYMFKTFSLHRAEYMVSELANDFRRGDYKKAGKDIMADVAVIGWEGLVELLIAFLKYGWQAFAMEEIVDTFAGAGLGVLGLNKHQALQLTRGQVGDFFQEMVGVGTPADDIGYMIRHADDPDKLLRAFLPDMILEPLIAGPKPISNKAKKIK